MERMHNSDSTSRGYRQCLAWLSLMSPIFMGGGVIHSFTKDYIKFFKQYCVLLPYRILFRRGFFMILCIFQMSRQAATQEIISDN